MNALSVFFVFNVYLCILKKNLSINVIRENYFMYRAFLFVLLVVTSTFAQGESNLDEYAKRDRVKNAKRIQDNSVPFDFSVGATLNVGYKGINGMKEKGRYAAEDRVLFFGGADFQVGAMAQVPLIKNNLAVKLGALFEYAGLDLRKPVYVDDENGGYEQISSGGISQGRIAFPVLFALKYHSMPVMFELGSEFSIPLFDSFNPDAFDERKIDSSIEVGVLLGFGAQVHKYISIDLLLDAKVYHEFRDRFIDGVSDWSSVFFKVGVTVNPQLFITSR